MKKRNKIIISISSSIIGVLLVIVFLLYGPISYFRELLITTAMSTMKHQYLATIFYDNKTIEDVLKKHKIIEKEIISNPDLITIKKYGKIDKYESKTEEEILKKDNNNDLYKIIHIKEKTFQGYLVAIYDPTKVKVATSSKLNLDGEYLDVIAKNNNAEIAINGGGFQDLNWNSNGAIALGTIIQNGNITYNGEQPLDNGGIVGFTEEGKMIIGKMSSQKAISLGIKEALEYGPFLIIDGKKSEIVGNGGSGISPRTVIGQRKDGIVLFLVIDGRQVTSIGANMKDLINVMSKYKAFNAINLDGGSSTALIINNKIINSPTAKEDNGLRKIPTAFIVTGG